MEVAIRELKKEDYAALNEMRRMEGVYEGTLGLPSERLEISQMFFDDLDDGTHMFVAEVCENGAKKVVGCAGLDCDDHPRARHIANFGIMVHRDYQNKGIGTMLTEAALDTADNWLMLVRVTLTVFTDNERAIALYKKMGFEIEGTLRASATKDGRFADEYVMGRIRMPGGKQG